MSELYNDLLCFLAVTDAAYSQKLRSSAESLYTFAKTIKGLYNNDIWDGAKFYKSSRYQDEMCTSATLLYMLTNDATYLTEAEAAYNEYGSDSAPWAFDWDDKTALCQVLLYVATQKSVYKSRTERFVTSYMPGGSLPYTDCGLAFRLEWGSLRYSANAAFISLLAAQNGIGNADAYKTWAMSQIHYMVGDNNRDFSYLIGYGSSYPLKPHHSGSSCSPAPAPCDWSTYGSSDPNPNVLRGALVGGPDLQDNYVDDRNNFKTNEVTCDYNAGFQSAVAGLLHFALNGNLPAAPARKSSCLPINLVLEIVHPKSMLSRIKSTERYKLCMQMKVGNGEQDHSLWRRAEDIKIARPVYYLDSNKKGSDVVGETVAAMAAGAMVFKDKDAAYSEKLRSSAESLYSFSMKIKGLYNDDISDGAKFYKSSMYQDEMCTSATLLYMLTNDATYLTEAEAAYNEYATDLAPWAFDWDDKTAMCQILLYITTKKPVYKSRTETFVTSYMPGGSLNYTKCGLAFRLEWGSLRYSANAALISLLAAQNGIGNAESYKTWAMSQIHYMIGDNNKNFSYLIGYGSSYPLKPHHRDSSCSPAPAPCDWNTFGSSNPNPNVLRGALVGGPDENDNYVDDRANFKTNEVTCDYNAGFQSAVAGLLHFALNGNLPASPMRKC
ncbi:endoglucanase A-like [Saccostrea cucullata]|uniref:endoglucanase A-like n=1 Tax=Saccostrea cuccullata TaxID=36930 RepID=UPI002ED0C0F5